MTVHATQPTAEEASRQIAADIRAYPRSGPDKREEHLRLFGGLLSRDDIQGAWADRYAEIALAGKTKLANLSARLEGLRPKIEEVANDPNLGALFKKSETKPAEVETKAAPAYRRIAISDHVVNSTGPSLFCLLHNLRLNQRERTRQKDLGSLLRKRE